MVREAQKKGLATEEKMWQSVAKLGEGLAALEVTDPNAYWRIMRDQHRIMYDGHYSEEMAEHDVAKLRWTTKDGQKGSGAHWTKEQVTAATAGRAFPRGVNEWDKWVAYNSMWSDLTKELTDEEILKAAWLFYFADEDWHEGKECTKIWDYMAMAHS